MALDVVFRDGAPLPVRAEDVACRDLRRVLTWFLPGSTSPGVLCVAAKALAMARPEDRIKATGGTVAHFCKAVGSQRLPASFFEDRIKAAGGTVAHFCKAVGSQRLPASFFEAVTGCGCIERVGETR